MKPFKNLRILQEGKFVLGAAAGGCLVGAVAALMIPPLPWVSAPLPPATQVTVRIAHGVGLGWWAGLFWGVFTALLARSQAQRPEVATLPTLGLWAAGAGLLALGVGVLMGFSAKASVLASLLVALVATRFGLFWVSRDRS